MFMVLRAAGLGVSIDFYYDSRDKKFIYLILCWSFWIIANFFPILADTVGIGGLMELFLVLNIIFVVLGITFLCWGFFAYYMNVPFKLMITLIVLFITIPFLLFILINYIIAIAFSTVLVNALLLSTYILPPIKKKAFFKYIGKTIRWYYATILTLVLYFPVNILIFSLGYRYGLYNAENLFVIILYYIPGIASTLLLIILLVHLEYTISSREKYKLKDKYSHNLGNIMQAITSAYELYSLKIEGVKESTELDNLLKSKITEAAKLIKDIREL